MAIINSAGVTDASETWCVVIRGNGVNLSIVYFFFAF